jgi:cell division protease FtsH
MRKVPLSDDVKPAYIARGTPGFSGADLANLVNEAALFAARSSDKLVTQKHFEQAKDKILMGVERKSMIMNDKERRMTAYHEAGHAIVGYLVPEHDPVYKVSIMPRGRALGVTMYLPEEDVYSYSKQKLESQLSSLYGGRVAEEQIYGSDLVTTGASNDIERATHIARNMVTKWGLSDNLGPLLYEEEDSGFMGSSRNANVSEEISRSIDVEMRNLIDRNYKRAQDILKEHADKLEIMTETLMEFETIDAVQIKNIMEGLPPGKPKDWEDSDDEGSDSVAEKALEEKKIDDVVSDDLSGDGVPEQGEPKLH